MLAAAKAEAVKAVLASTAASRRTKVAAKRRGTTVAPVEEASSAAAASAVASSVLGDLSPSASGTDRLRDAQSRAEGSDQLSVSPPSEAQRTEPRAAQLSLIARQQLT